MGGGLDRGEREAKVTDGLGGQIIRNHRVTTNKQEVLVSAQAGRCHFCPSPIHISIPCIPACTCTLSFWQLAGRTANKAATHTYIHPSPFRLRRTAPLQQGTHASIQTRKRARESLAILRPAYQRPTSTRQKPILTSGSRTRPASQPIISRT